MYKVISADGTAIACETAGKGPHLVLVHGTSAARNRWATVRAEFEKDFTVTVMDRRGRGDSGDAADYAIEREFEDVATVVNACGGPVLLFGHSFGAICALEAAARTDNLSGVVLYEAPVFQGDDGGLNPEMIDRLQALLDAGDREGVVTTFMQEVVRMPPHEFEHYRTLPAWPARVAAAHTLPRENRTVEHYRRHAELPRLAVPVLLLLGGDSPPFFSEAVKRLEAVLADTRMVVMPGQQHIAMDTAPEMVVKAVRDFAREIGVL